MYAEAVETGEVGVTVVAEDAQGDGLEGLVAQPVRVVDHAEILHRLRGATHLVSAFGDQSMEGEGCEGSEEGEIRFLAIRW